MDDDSPETIAAGFTLGLQHPPGYALDSLFNRCFSLLPLGGPCFRMNVGSALLASLCVVLLAALIRKTLLLLFPGRRAPSNPSLLFSAATGALLFAFSKTCWEKALCAKGSIYLLGTVLIFLLLAFLLGQDVLRPSSPRRWLSLAFLVFGAGFADHWETHLVFFPIVVFFFVQISPARASLSFPAWKELLGSLGFAILGASPLLYLPLRAHLHPDLDLGAPDSLSYFMADFFRKYTSDREVSVVQTFFQALVGHVPWRKWTDLLQFILDLQGRQISVHLWEEMKLPALLLAGLGLFAWMRSGERKILFCLLTPCLLLFLALCSASWIPPGPFARWYMDNFLMPVNWVIGFLAGVGLCFALGFFTQKPWIRAAFLVVACLPPLCLVLDNFRQSDLERQMIRYDYGTNLLKSLPAGSVFFAESDEDYFSLYYLQLVEHKRPDVRMIPAFTLFEPWGVEQVERQRPELGLTASSLSFSDHFQRITFAMDEIVQKNVQRIPCGFSYFDGAFHRFYLAGHPALAFRKSGLVWLFDTPPVKKVPLLALDGLRLRHWTDCPSNGHPALSGIWDIYRSAGLFD